MSDKPQHGETFARVEPNRLYADYQGPGQFAPEDPEEIKLFDQALIYELAHNGAPLEYRDAYEMPPKALAWAMTPQSARSRNLVLWGNVGVGKTHAAVAAGCLYAGVHGTTFKFLQSHSWLRTAKNWDSKGALEEARADATIPGVVVLDDIGRSKASETDVETLTELMDNRRMALKPTIFTTNLTPPEFGEIFGDHLSSRLLGSALQVFVAGKDRR